MNKKCMFKVGAVSLTVLLSLIMLTLVLTSFSVLADSEEYLVGDKIKLTLGEIGEYTLKIETPSNTLIKKSSDSKFIFEATEAGKYSISVKSSETSKTFTYFVSEGAEKPSSDNHSLEESENGSILPLPGNQSSDSQAPEPIDNPNNLTLESNFSREDFIQVGKPVVWKKKIKSAKETLQIKIPELAENISLTKKEIEADFKIKESLMDSVSNVFKEENEKSLIVKNAKGSLELEYTTPAPQKEESNISQTKKEVIVSSEIHYEEVLSITTLPKEISDKEQVKVYWEEEERYLDFIPHDTNNNSLIDTIEWIIPHLSTQTFEIIVIDKAEHLDSNRTFIADVYSKVKSQDDIWTTIPDGEFLRVRFEKNLTNKKDLTLYARAENTSYVNVFPKDSNVLITSFEIKDEDTYQSFLTNLSEFEAYDTFDLQVLGEVEFDYVVDPTVINLTSIHLQGWEAGAGGWSDPGADSDRSTASPPGSRCQDDGSLGGSFTWHLQDDTTTSLTSQNFDFSAGHNVVNVSFSAYYRSIEGAERLDFKCDGTTLWSYEANTLGTEDQWLNGFADSHGVLIYPDNCTFDSSVTLTFEAEFSGNGDEVYIDCLNVTGLFIVNQPTHSNPILNFSEDTDGKNMSNLNLTCHNQSTQDLDGDNVKNIYSWYKDASSIELLHMPFEAGSNSSFTQDYSDQSNNGTVVGATFNATGGHDGFGAYDFDGSSNYISTSSDLSPILGRTATLSFFVKTTQVGQDTMWQAPGITGIEQAGGGNDIFWGWIDASGRMGFTAGNGNAAKTASAINDGSFHHIAITRDAISGLVEVYLDGSLSGSAISETGNKTLAFTSFGRIEDSGGTPVYFDGVLDDILVYDYVLSPEQISAIYNQENYIQVSEETVVGDVWTCAITPTDGTLLGETKQSNNQTILGNAPSVSFDFITPSSNINVVKDEVFSTNTNLSCTTADCGNINTSIYYKTKDWFEGIESGTSGWVGSTFTDFTDQSYEGTHSIGTSGGTMDANITPKGWQEGVRPEMIEYYWWEQSAQTGFTVDFFDSTGATVMRNGGNNPQWELSDGDGDLTVYTGDGYERWIHYKFTFNWTAGTYDYFMQDTSTSNSRSGTRSLSTSTNISKIRLSGDYAAWGNANRMRFDAFKATFPAYQLINTTSGATPLYVIGSNPVNISLNEDESQEVTIQVNATGPINSTYQIFTMANQTSSPFKSNQSSIFEVFISDNREPSINQMQCEEAGSWKSCGEVDFGETITRVRANVTDDISVTNVSFNFSNTPDSYTFFTSNATSNTGDFWIYDNTDITINDSGEFVLDVIAYDESLTSTDTSPWDVAWGSILITLLDPSTSGYVNQNEYFNFTARVTCSAGECGDLNVTLDPVNWWDENWEMRKEINITGYHTLSDFPVYLNISYDADMQTDFEDLRFTNGSCKDSSQTQIPHETEDYDAASAKVWVKIPTFTSGTNQICMYYKNYAASSGDNKTEVWEDSFKLVQHLSETPAGTGGTHYDSTSYGNDGTTAGAMNTDVTGIVGGADNFAGDNDYINCGSDSSLGPSNQVTISAWVYRTSAAIALIAGNGGGWGSSGYQMMDLNGQIRFEVNAVAQDTSSISNNQWHYLTFVYDGSSMSTYVDGAFNSGGANPGSITPSNQNFGIGYGLYGSYGGGYFTGVIDEVRVSNISRSANWINQSYHIVNDQSSIVTFGTEEKGTKGVVPMGSGNPFYTTDQNPTNSTYDSCLSDMKSRSCDIRWQLNSTGELNSKWKFFVLSEAINYSSVTSAESTKINLTIIEAQDVPPNITIHSPLNGTTFADVTPYLNVSIDGDADELWYSFDPSTENVTLCTSCTAGTYTKLLGLPEGDYDLIVYADNVIGEESQNTSSFTIDMNYNYFDTFTDNSSLLDSILYNVTWGIGNISFSPMIGTETSSWDSFTQTGDATASNSGRSQYSFRLVISSTYMNNSGDYMRLKFQAATDGNLAINNPTICERSGSTSDCVPGTWENLTIGGSQNYIIQNSQENWTDWMYYPMDQSKDYLVSFYLDGSNNAVGYLSSVNGNFHYQTSGQDISLVENWSSYSPTFEQYFYGLEELQVRNESHEGNFTAFEINTSQTIAEIKNITWSESGTDSNNNITVEISADNGQNWQTATKNLPISTLVTGSSLIYRVSYKTNKSTTISLLDMNITWTNETAPPASITINSPQDSSTIADVTPTLNVTLGDTAHTLWYNIDGGSNQTLCTSCGSTQSIFMGLSEGTYTVNVFTNNSLGQENHEASTFTIDMNYNYFDTFNDNSSLLGSTLYNVTWNSGNISFNGSYYPLSYLDDDFDDGSYSDGSPITWTPVSNAAGCSWSIQSGILTESSNCNDGSRDVTAMGGYIHSGSQQWTDVNISARLRSTDNDGTGMMFRYVDDNNYYRVRFEGTSNYRRLEKIESGAVTILDSDTLTDGGLTEDVWHDVSIVTSGNQLDVYLNGALVLNATDSTFSNGSIAMYSWAQDTGAYGADFDDVTVTDLSPVNGNFTSFEINTTETITEIKNVTWTETGTSPGNNITVEISADYGQNWQTATKNQGIIGIPNGNSLVYRVTFTSNGSTVTLNDMNITWTDQTTPPPGITINSPTGTFADVTPLLNVTLNDTAASLLYNIDGGTNKTLCYECSGEQTEFLGLAEGTYTLNVYAKNVIGDSNHESETFTIDMNYNYFDTFTDNSSLLDSILYNVTWNIGNISFAQAPPTSVLSDDFDDSSYSDGSPITWTPVSNAAGCSWSIQSGILTESSNCNNGDRDGLALGGYIHSGSQQWTDVNISARLRSTDNDGTGIMFRYVDDNNYYRVRFEGTSNYRRLERIESGAVTVLDSDILADGGLTEDTWHDVSIITSGNQLDVYLNGALVLNATDSTFSNGSIAMYSWAQDTGAYGADFDDVTVQKENPVTGNFTAFEINTTSTITEIKNVTWTESGTDANNNITVEISADHGQSWETTTKNQPVSSINPGSSLLYRVLFQVNDSNSLIFLNDMNITWTDQTTPPPGIRINAPLPSSTIADVTPTLNVTLNETADTLWFNVDGGSNQTICKSCTGEQISFAYLAEGSYTINFFANNSLGSESSNSTTFTVDMNKNYFDTFTDNSSFTNLNGTTWNVGNITFTPSAGQINASWDAFTQAGTSSWANSGRSHHSFRLIVSSTYLNTSGNQIRLKFQAGTDNSLGINRPTICERSASTSNCVPGTWENLTFDGSQTYVISASQENWTDWIRYDLDESKDYLVSYYLDATNDGVGYLSSTNGNFHYQVDNQDLSQVENWSSYSPTFEQYFYGLEELIVRNDELVKIVDAYNINTTNQIKKIVNVTWNDAGTDAQNTVKINLSIDGGSNWYNVSNGGTLSPALQGDSLIYRIIFSAYDSIPLSLLDMNITWSAPPSINILYPLSATYPSHITELNYTVAAGSGVTLDECWYSLDNGTTNHSITCGDNVTGITSVEGDNYWTVYANDSESALGHSTVYFIVDSSAPQIELINQTDEDDNIVDENNPLVHGQNLTINLNVTDSNLDKVWITIWDTVKGGAQKLTTFFTYVAGTLWTAMIPTDSSFDALEYVYTIYANDTAGYTSELDGNFSFLKITPSISLDPNPSPGTGNVSISGSLSLTNGTALKHYPINLWLDDELLLLENLTAIGSYNNYQNFTDTSDSEFSEGELHQTVSNGQNVSLSGTNLSGNFTRTLDAGAKVEWDVLTWDASGGACSATLNWQNGVDSFTGSYDTYLDGDNANTNYGSSSSLFVDSSPAQRALIKFDVIGQGGGKIPFGSTIFEANLTTSIFDAGDTVNVYEILEDWNADDATYNHRLTGGTSWSSLGCTNYPSRASISEGSFSPSSAGNYTVNVTEVIRRWTNQTTDNYGWVFIPGGGNLVQLRSNEYTSETFRPKLSVKFNSSDCTSTQLYVRFSDNKQDWTSWQEATSGSQLSDPNRASRYLQYRAVLTTVNSTVSPFLNEVVANYTAVVTDEFGGYEYNVSSPTSFGNYILKVNSSYKTTSAQANESLSVQAGVSPEVELIAPQDNAWSSTGELNLTYNASDGNSDIIYTTLIIDGIDNKTNETQVPNAEYTNFSINLSSGTYNWTVKATDSNGNNATATPRIIYVDLEDPVINLISPEDYANLTLSILNLSFNVTDNMDDSLVCNVTLDGIKIETGLAVANASTQNVSSGILTSGLHYWKVDCIDESGRNPVSETRTINITDTPPTVTLVEPLAGYTDDNGEISFMFTPSDNSGFSNCSLLINGTFNSTNQSQIVNGENNTINVTGLVEGFYNWTVECFDLSSSSHRPTARNFSVDLNPPTIELNGPSNDSTLDFSDVNFNFTATDAIDSSLDCELTINNVLMSSPAATSGLLTNVLVENLTDGIKYWNVTCSDDMGFSNQSSTWKTTIEELPVIELNTANESSFSSSDITLYYTPSDNSNFSSCSIYLNGALNTSNTSIIQNGVLSNFELEGLLDGEYNWYVNCTDTYGLVNNSETRTFFIDAQPPIVTLHYPDGQNIFSNNITVNFSVIDAIDSSLTCNVTVDSSVELENLNVANNTFVQENLTGITDGYHDWYVNCTDSAGNYNTSSTFNFTKMTEPGITLVLPADGYWFNSSTINLTYYPEDDEGIATAFLFINGELNETNQTPVNTFQNNTFTLSPFPEGFFNWSITLTDLSGMNGTSENRSFYVDTTPPTLVLNAPDDDVLIETNNVTFNFTINDSVDSSLTCNLTVDAEVVHSGEVPNATEEISYQILSDGVHHWNVTCWDEVNHIVTSETRNLTVEAPPNVTLDSPNNGNRTTLGDINFSYTPIDPISITSCSIYLDDVLNQTTFTMIANQQNNFTIEGIAEGVHNWTVNCTDSDSNTFAPTPYNLIVDQSPPVIVLNSPGDDLSIDANSNVIFNWTATDSLDTLISCDLFVDGNLEEPNILATSGIPVIEAVSGLSQGYHTWNVTCEDTLGNSNNSETFRFNLTIPDFQINETSISFNPEKPKENETVTINVTVHNLGFVETSDVQVKFYEGDPSSGGTQIGSTQTINIAANSLNFSTINYKSPLGSTEIYVTVDEIGDFSELNETNNNASKVLDVSTWHFFYGDMNTDNRWILGDSTDSNLTEWNKTTLSNTNIYFADYDSSIEWSSLQAIGKKDDNTDSSNDITEIDTALGMTGYQDSVATLYLNGSDINRTDSYIVFSRIINSVPETYSINNSNFDTGILWDMDDDTNGEYDGTELEDLVFVTKVNLDQQGAYGITDYEARVPALLREYKSATTDKAAYYIELK